MRYTEIPKLNISGKAIEGNSFSVNDYQMLPQEVGNEDSFSIIVIFPILQDNQMLIYGMIDNAVKKVCEQEGIDFMTNVKVYVNQWYIPYIYGKFTMSVKGEGWKKSSQAALMEELNKLGTVVTQTEAK